MVFVLYWYLDKLFVQNRKDSYLETLNKIIRFYLGEKIQNMNVYNSRSKMSELLKNEKLLLLLKKKTLRSVKYLYL